MKSRTLLAIAVTVLLLLTAASFVFLGTGRDSQETDIIQLPEGDASSLGIVEEIAARNREAVKIIALDKTNVVSLIASLSKPDFYHLESRTVLYSPVGNLSGSFATDTDGGFSRVTSRENGKITGEYILTPDTLYFWTEESGGNYTVTPKGDIVPEELFMFPSYERICALPSECITDASLSDDLEILSVDVDDPETGYHTEYRLSVSDGMILSVTASKGDQKVYNVERLVLEIGINRSSAYVLPDGTVLK